MNDTKKKSSEVLGIDFGTTNSCVSYRHEGQVRVLENAEGRRITPSYIAFTESGDIIIGDAAKRQAHTNPTRTFNAFKRFVGREYNEVEKIVSKLPYQVVPVEKEVDSTTSDGDGVKKKTVLIPHVIVNNEKVTAEYLIAMYLQKLLKQLSDTTGKVFSRVCITVPSNAGDAQRQATKLACEIAGLEVLRITNESTAAALAYGLDKNKGGRLVVFDLGGGTFDVTVLEVEDGVFTVLATGGDDFLGGEDIDLELANYCNKKFRSQPGNESINLLADKLSFSRLVAACKEGKEALAHSAQVTISSPFIYDRKHLEVSIDRAIFDNEIADKFIDRCIVKTKQVLSDCDVTPDQVTDVVLAGGSTRLLIVERKLIQLFGNKIRKDINPDECVAIGAGIQGCILSGGSKGIAFTDVNPMDIRVSLFGGSTFVMISRNTLLPARHEQIFSTVADNQTTVSAVICQGNSPIADENHPIGEIVLTSIKEGPRSSSQIAIVTEIDTNGIITVFAEDKRASEEAKKSGASFKQTFHPSAGLSKDKIAEYIKKAQENKDRDELREKHINLDAQVHNYQYDISNVLANVEPSKKADIESRLTKVSEEYKVLSDEKVYDQEALSKKQAVVDKFFEIFKEVKKLEVGTSPSPSAEPQAVPSPEAAASPDDAPTSSEPSSPSSGG